MDKLSQEEYEIQFYGMSLKKINSTIKEELYETFLNNIDQMYATFKGKSKDMDSDTYKKLLLEKENVKKVILSKLETPVEKFQTHLYKNLRIADNILLPEDEIFANSVDGNIIEELNSTISNLEKEILKTKYKIKEISLKKQRMENLSKEIEELKTSILNIGDEENNIAVDNIITKMKEMELIVSQANDKMEKTSPIIKIAKN